MSFNNKSWSVFVLITVYCLLFTAGFVSANDDLQVWRNASTSTDVITFDNNGNIDFSGLITGNGSGLTSIQAGALNLSDINYWSRNAANELYYNTANVGIGIANPAAKLDIRSDTNDAFRIRASNGNTRFSFLTFTNEGQFNIFSGGTNRILLRTGGDSYIDSGNVGIGTTSPDSLLNIRGADPVFKIENSGTSGTEPAEVLFQLHGSTTDYKTRILSERDASSFGTQMSFWTRPNSAGDSVLQRMTISREGNVGIGITAPSTKLEVNGTAKVEELNVKNARMFIDSEGDMVFRV